MSTLRTNGGQSQGLTILENDAVTWDLVDILTEVSKECNWLPEAKGKYFHIRGIIIYILVGLVRSK